MQTFVQISDLHVGDLDCNGNTVHDRFVKTLWTFFPFFTGLAGHETQALVHLAEFYNDLRERDPHAILLVTGDLTSTAKKSQFERAVQFVEEELPPPSSPKIGLRTEHWLRATMSGPHARRHEAIPGNHDHWPGRWFWCWLLGRPGSQVRTWRRRFPLTDIYLPLDTKRHLRLLALNSDAGVWGWSFERIFARGSFQAQVRHLQNLLKEEPADPNEIRVLLLHHSLIYKARNDPRFATTSRFFRKWYRFVSRLGTLEMNKASRGGLYRLLARADIRVLLSGHVHLAEVRTIRPLRVLEARCGTTTQLNKVPRKWPFANKKLDDNTLLVHQVFEDTQGRIIWKTETWTRDRVSGFQPDPRNKQGEPFATELVVWPR